MSPGLSLSLLLAKSTLLLFRTADWLLVPLEPLPLWLLVPLEPLSLEDLPHLHYLYRQANPVLMDFPSLLDH
uniref:Secreted protein n=1 Tax=Salix viminalis TaxID=40686 RepID=A0A6N2MB83_SALVM